MSLDRAERVSNRQYNFMMIFDRNGPDYVMDEDTLTTYHMGTAGSLAKRREPIVIRTVANGRKGLKLSAYGADVLRAYKDTDIRRKNPGLDLSQWVGTYLRSGRDERDGRTMRRARRVAG